MTKYLEKVVILDNTEISKDNYLLKVKSENLLGKKIIPKIGQFYMINCGKSENILRRPISLHSYNEENGELPFYCKVVGKGSSELTKFKKNNLLDIQGPLGNGFTIDYENKNIVIIGGGVGLAPLKELVNKMKKNNKIIFIAGARNREEIKIVDNFNISEIDDIELNLCTDDGSVGEKSFTTYILNNIIKNKKNKIDIIYACGPHKMLELVGQIANENNIICELSLEERMACGVKACVGCSIRTLEGMKKVCYDGPIFDSKLILLNSHIEKGVQDGCCCE